MMNTSTTCMSKMALIFFCLLWGLNNLCGVPYMGTITFPANFTISECPGVYCNGYAIPVEMSTHPRTVASFAIESEPGARRISLLFVADAVEPTCHDTQRGIPSCLRVPSHGSYRHVELTQTEICSGDKKEKSDTCVMTWKMHEKPLEKQQVPE